MILADEIREYAYVSYIKPARRKGSSTIEFSATMIHEGMGLANQFQAVCAAIDTQKFLKYADVTLLNRSGPHQSTTVNWVFLGLTNMTIPEIVSFQKELVELLDHSFGHSLPVVSEWRTKFGEGLYSPRVDIAVGPFATTHGEQLVNEYDKLLNHPTNNLISALMDIHLQNTGEQIDPGYLIQQLQGLNRNARCFLAIEIENTGSRKHLMGDAVNAAALGRIGIVVGWTPEMFRAFLNLKRYFDYLGSVGKNTFNLGNLLIVNPDQFLESISTAH